MAVLSVACALSLWSRPPALHAQSADPPVIVVVHVPLRVPGTACARGAAPPATQPLDGSILERFDDELGAYGSVTDHLGAGSSAGPRPGDPLAFDLDDHIFITTTASKAKRFLPGFLHELRVRLHQRAVAGEIVGDALAMPGRQRVHLNVVMPYDDATFARLRRLHALFDAGGKSTATEYDDNKGVHVYAGVPFSDAIRIEAALTAARYLFTAAHEWYVTENDSRC